MVPPRVALPLPVINILMKVNPAAEQSPRAPLRR